MSSQRDLTFGNLAVELGLLSREQVQAALVLQDSLSKQNQVVPLGEISMIKGWLIQKDVDQVLKLQTERYGELLIPGYKVLARIGEGGMASIYSASSHNGKGQVAIKILSSHLGREKGYVDQFVQEAKLACTMDHPNIVKGMEYGESDGIYYYVMELLPGETTEEYLHQNQVMPETQALRVTLQMARALDYFHSRRMIHRDIKPDNIIMSPEGHAKLCDFGLARDVKGKTSFTIHGIILGTPNYSSPEQAQGLPDIDIRSDIYSLGATLFHFLTGEPPFDGDQSSQILTQVVSDPFPDIRAINPLITIDTARIIARMTRKNPDHRYKDPSELIQALESRLKNSPIQPDSDKASAPGRLSNRRKALAATGPLIALIIMGIVSLFPPSRQKSNPEPETKESKIEREIHHLEEKLAELDRERGDPKKIETRRKELLDIRKMDKDLAALRSDIQDKIRSKDFGGALKIIEKNKGSFERSPFREAITREQDRILTLARVCWEEDLKDIEALKKINAFDQAVLLLKNASRYGIGEITRKARSALRKLQGQD